MSGGIPPIIHIASRPPTWALHIYLIASSFHGFDDGQKDTPASLKNYVTMQSEVQHLFKSKCWTLAERTVPIQCLRHCTEYYSKCLQIISRLLKVTRSLVSLFCYHFIIFYSLNVHLEGYMKD